MSGKQRCCHFYGPAHNSVWVIRPCCHLYATQFLKWNAMSGWFWICWVCVWFYLGFFGWLLCGFFSWLFCCCCFVWFGFFCCFVGFFIWLHFLFRFLFCPIIFMHKCYLLVCQFYPQEPTWPSAAKLVVEEGSKHPHGCPLLDVPTSLMAFSDSPLFLLWLLIPSLPDLICKTLGFLIFGRFSTH